MNQYILLQAKEYFEKAADNEEPGGDYSLGVMYLKGIGVKRDVKRACRYFTVAAIVGQPKAFQQLAKMCCAHNLHLFFKGNGSNSNVL